MINNNNGRARSKRTRAELEALLKKSMAGLSPAEREAMEIVLQEMTMETQSESVGLLSALGQVEYKHTPVDMRTFVKDPYYLGNTCDNIYPILMSDLEELFSGGYHEAILTGSIGWGKCLKIQGNSILDASSGVRIPLSSLVGTSPVVPSLKNGKIDKATAALVWKSGSKPCKRLVLSGGQTIEASYDHPVLTNKGWVPIARLEPDDLVSSVPDSDALIMANLGQLTPTWSQIKALHDIGVHEVADLTVPETANVIFNGVVVHNTHIATIGLCRVIYELSCMKDPAKSFGIARGSNISMVCTSVNETLAVKVVFEAIASKLKASPYFENSFPFEETKKEIRFPNGIFIAAKASTDTGALGLNAISALMDESNFLQKTAKEQQMGVMDRAETIYNTIQRRMKSRFERSGKLPGMLFVVSSKKTTEDFTAKRIRAAVDDPTVFVRDYCLAGETRIPLLDGTTPTIKELADRYASDPTPFWVYSIDSENRVVPGKAHHPRLTSKNEPVLRVTLDDGSDVVATPWHPFRMKNGGYIRASELVPGDSLASLAPLYRRINNAGMPKYSELKRLHGHSSPNHKVTSVVPAGVADVYDLSVEEHSNFAVGAGVFVHNSLWETKPSEYYSPNKFWVLGGNESVPSKILTDDEHDKLKDTVPEGVSLVHVPEDFRIDFERDLEGSLRDLAGVASVSVNPFIHRREKILECIDPALSHPFSEYIYDPSKGGHFMWSSMVREVLERGGRSDYASNVLRPILNPKIPRHIHIDPSYRKDATGVCMAHISGWKDVPRRAEDGKEFMERAPIFTVDLMLRIVPPVGGELVLGDIRHIVYDLSAHGYIITGVTMDTWGGPDSVQQLNQRGFNASFLSVDTSTDPYENLKTALYENRLHYYEYTPVIEELQHLERHIMGKRVKIDHPPKGRKDVADALAATCHALATTQVSQPLPMLRGVSLSGDAWLEEQQQAKLGGSKVAAVNTDVADLPPFLTGSGGGGGGWDPRGGGGWSSW